MKQVFILLLVLFAAVGAIFALPFEEESLMEQGPKKSQGAWKRVEDATNKGRPQTAIQELEPIIKAALRDKKHAEATKAITMKIALEGNIQGNKPEEKITRLEAVMAEVPDDMKPTLEVVLANWYWHYFQRNRWRFLQRTQTEEPPGDDITSWDLARILAEIDKHFTAALAAETILQKTPIAEFDDLLIKGSMPDSFRPTLYDFVAHEALRFYSAGEQAGSKAQDSFVLTADGPIFAPVAEFIAWKTESNDLQSPLLKAIQLTQKLLAFHQNDDDPSALADADLERLAFGFNHAYGEEKDARYKAALKRFSGRWADHPIFSRALHAWASVLQGENLLSDAHELAQRGLKAYPDSPGGVLCFNLIQQIEAKSIQVETERVWNNPWPTIQVQYRNITKIHFRAVKYEWESLLQRANYYPGQVDSNLRTELLRMRPDRAWSRDLPPTDDFQPAQQFFSVPDDLRPGFYFLIASVDQGFGAEDNQVLVTDFWASTLALVLRTGQSASGAEGFVLDADTGEPLANAQLRVWSRVRAGRQYKWTQGQPTQSDRNGKFQVLAVQNQNCIVLASHRGQELATASVRNYFNQGTVAPFERTVFFTDRSLYRPGQTVRYKGICIAVDQSRDDYKTLAARDITVAFLDANGQEISKQQCRTNDLGSFSGSVTAPRDRLMGRMRLLDTSRQSSETWFNVEEYKRPKFKVELASPDQPARLGAKVGVKGTAKAYTGAAIDGANVKYRVVRQVRYPIWWYWRCWWNPPTANAQEITHGATTTETDGSFSVEFQATPDPSVSEKDEPTFQFTVYADVTDSSGETRSDQRTVNVGFTALQASMAATEWQTNDKDVEINVATQSLDDQPQAAQGTIRIHRLRQPTRVYRAAIQGQRMRPFPSRSDQEPKPDPANPNSWLLGPVVHKEPFATDATGTVTKSFALEVGAYRALLETQDAFGNTVTAVLPITVIDPDANQFPIKIANLVAAPRWSVEPGETFTALWGTGYEAGMAFVEIEHRGKVIQSYWTRRGATQATIEQSVSEAMRGGFTLRVTQVRENRGYLDSRRVDVPWTNKQLSIQWEHFVSKLKPGQEETWTAVISGPKAKQAAAEMVAALYDASLDAYLPHQWQGLTMFRQDYSRLNIRFENYGTSLQSILGRFQSDFKQVTISYRALPPDIIAHLWGFQAYGRRQLGMAGGMGGMPAPSRGASMAQDGAAMPMAMEMAEGEPAESLSAMRKAEPDSGLGGGAGPQSPAVDLSQVTARTNLNETAFFFPHLVADETGKVTMQFTMPEALTEWKFQAFAHDNELRNGLLVDKAVTSKDLMVQPQPPRFVREGDVVEFTVKVTNQSPSQQTGTVRLTLADARTLDTVDHLLGNDSADRAFGIPSKQSRSFSWRLTVPDGMGFLTYKAVGSTGRLSDGEEGFLPVLSRRILVTESLPLPIRGAQTKDFTFHKLIESANSDTLQHQSLTVQMVSNPAWYAVMALPYLMEYPHECTEQTFNRLYANALARHIANSDPKIRRIFDQWKGTPTLDSPLEKNEELKAVLLEETPWVRDSQKESEARRNVGILFDANRLNEEMARVLRKLTEMQMSDGSWPWFPGGRPNDYITLYITTGFGRLRHLGTDIDVAPAVKALDGLDRWIDKLYRDIIRDGDKDKNHLSRTIAFYLYGRSFFLDDKKIDGNYQEAVDYFLSQARQYWLQLANRQSQAHLAIALNRFGDRETARDIMVSIKERSVTDDELGMFWRETELSWWWYRAPIETQAMMIEAFDEVMNDRQAVEGCRVWLLKQKQTQDWKTTKATADAVYGLLLRGTDLLASDALVRVSLGDIEVRPEKVEAGTGFYEERYFRGEIKPKMGQVKVTKTDSGVSWGAVHWQYLEDMSKVTPYEGTPLTLKKMLYIKENTNKGPVLKRVAGPLSVGDELVVRIELRVDRDMEYIHMKDQRGCGTEPVDVLSRYRFQDGLAYYQSTRDTASHFFIDYLPKGTYVFEYSTRVVHRGQYQSGMAQIQCMYAPEFNSHSESLELTVE